MAQPPLERGADHRAAAGGVGMFAQEVHGGDKVLGHFFPIALALQCSAIVVIAGITAERRERVRRECDETGNGEPPRDIFDIRIESAVLVYHNDAGQLVISPGRPRKVTAHYARTFRRRILLVAYGDGFVVGINLLRQRIVRTQHRQQGCGGDATRGEACRTVEKFTTGNAAVHVAIEQLPYALVDVEFPAHASTTDVVFEMFDLFLLIGDDGLHEIANRNHRDNLSVLDDRQVP